MRIRWENRSHNFGFIRNRSFSSTMRTTDLFAFNNETQYSDTRSEGPNGDQQRNMLLSVPGWEILVGKGTQTFSQIDIKKFISFILFFL